MSHMTSKRILEYAYVPLFLLAVLYIAHASAGMEASGDGKGRDRLESSLRRAVAFEYAVTGAYPEDLESILEYHGIQIDRSRYAVYYTPVAENIPPELDVLDLEEQGVAP